MGRQSSIDRLPQEIREQLQALLRDPRWTQADVVSWINTVLEEEGHDTRLSKSAVNRYAVSMARVGERLQQSRAVAEMWIGKLGAQPQGKLGNLVNEILRTLAFDLSLTLQEGQIDIETAPAVAGMLKDLAFSMEKLERAASENVKREKQLALEIADAVEKAGEPAMSPARVREIIREAYGV